MILRLDGPRKLLLAIGAVGLTLGASALARQIPSDDPSPPSGQVDLWEKHARGVQAGEAAGWMTEARAQTPAGAPQAQDQLHRHIAEMIHQALEAHGATAEEIHAHVTRVLHSPEFLAALHEASRHETTGAVEANVVHQERAREVERDADRRRVEEVAVIEHAMAERARVRAEQVLEHQERIQDLEVKLQALRQATADQTDRRVVAERAAAAAERQVEQAARAADRVAREAVVRRQAEGATVNVTERADAAQAARATRAPQPPRDRDIDALRRQLDDVRASLEAMNRRLQDLAERLNRPPADAPAAGRVRAIPPGAAQGADAPRPAARSFATTPPPAAGQARVIDEIRVAPRVGAAPRVQAVPRPATPPQPPTPPAAVRARVLRPGQAAEGEIRIEIEKSATGEPQVNVTQPEGGNAQVEVRTEDDGRMTIVIRRGGEAGAQGVFNLRLPESAAGDFTVDRRRRQGEGEPLAYFAFKSGDKDGVLRYESKSFDVDDLLLKLGDVKDKLTYHLNPGSVDFTIRKEDGESTGDATFKLAPKAKPDPPAAPKLQIKSLKPDAIPPDLETISGSIER